MSIKGFLAPEQVALGRLILRTASPGQDFCPFSPVSLTSDDISAQPFESVSQLLSRYSDARYRLDLTRLLSAGSTASTRTIDAINTTKATTYQLLNSGLFFEKLTKDDQIRKWLEPLLRRMDVYLVVGLHTIESAHVNAGSDSGRKGDASVQVPTAQVAAAAGPPMLSENPLDVRLKALKAKGIETAASFVAPGERIVKVEYRKLRLRTFRSCDVDSAFLESGSRWKTYAASRDAVGPDMVEVHLEEGSISSYVVVVP
jgi:hypothetical protein